MNVLITGCNGYIGKILTQVVRDFFPDAFIIGVDKETRKQVNKNLQIQIFDDITHDAIATHCKAYDIDTVFHLGAEASVPDSLLRPYHYYEYNTAQTTTLINNLLDVGWKGSFVFSSSAGVYDKSRHPCKEFSTIKPPHPYGHSKRLTELMLEESIKYQSDIKFFTFRYFNVAGSYKGHGDHLDSGHVLQKICRAAITQRPFTVNGHDLQTRDGTCIRDYVHVMDICRAHLHIAEYLNATDGPFYDVCNLGSANGTSILELVDMFKEVSDTPLAITLGPPRDGDPEFLVADPNKFIDDYGFKYMHSSLKEIVCSAWKNYKQRIETTENTDGI